MKLFSGNFNFKRLLPVNPGHLSARFVLVSMRRAVAGLARATFGPIGMVFSFKGLNRRYSHFAASKGCIVVVLVVAQHLSLDMWSLQRVFFVPTSNHAGC